MRRSLTLVLLLALSSALLPAAPSSAATTRLVRMLDVEFKPRTIRTPVGGFVRWRNDGDLKHTTTTKKRYPTAWDKGIKADAAWRMPFRFAGRFGYYCKPHSDGTSGMVGRVEVPVKASPATGGNATRFVVKLASVVPPNGWAFEVQRKVNGNAWKTIKGQIAKRSFGYRSKLDGTHRFRARLFRIDLSVRHGWSPATKVTIT